MSSSFAIRPFIKIDLESLAKISSQTNLTNWNENILNSCFQSGYQGWVLFDENNPETIVAYAIIFGKTDEYELLSIAVVPQFQNKGLGRQLLEFIMTELKKQGVRQLHLEVRESNKIAQQFYRSLGFKYVGARPNYYPTKGGREAAVLMTVDLN